MIREKLTDAVATAAKKCGYSFFCGATSRMAGEMTAVPAAWLVPPEVVDVSGREQGTVKYKIALKLVDLDKRYTSSEKNAIWSRMETHAMAIYHQLSENKDIQAISSISWEPLECTFTPHNEISLDISMKIEMVFSKESFN